MPIANCVISPDYRNKPDRSKNLVLLWVQHSRISNAASEMTVNIICSSEQLGKKYMITANLMLPSVWSKVDVSSLQLGLAKALSEYYSLSLDQILVATSIINAGNVVEKGKEITW